MAIHITTIASGVAPGETFPVDVLIKSAPAIIQTIDALATLAKLPNSPVAKMVFRWAGPHALRNALNPVITTISGWLAAILAGAYFVEIIFDYKGLGYVTINALNTLDFPVAMGAVLFTAVLFVVVNILVDVLYGMLDPRVSLKD